ncbi:DUF4439 domain-containing protein [Isoptericola aurantiacus]|uniref:DUF4439 domain-containing protein n=1 Tax=Isoptericola aurantiacus TaxID=3377839 RepID=UPI00383A9FF4
MEPHTAAPPLRRRRRTAAGLLAVALLVSGCGLRLETPPPAEPVPDALEIVRRTAVSDALYVAEQADAAVDVLGGTRPGLAEELERVAADSREQADQLGGVYDSGLEPTASPSGSPQVAPSEGPVRPSDVVVALVEAAGRSRTAASTTADGDLARLIASIGAAQTVSASRVGDYTRAGPPPTVVPTVPSPGPEDPPAEDVDGTDGTDRESPPAAATASEDPGEQSADGAADTVTSTGPGSDEPVPVPRGLTAGELSTLVESEDSAGYALRLRAALRTDGRRTRLADRADVHTDRSRAWSGLAGTAGTDQDPRRTAYAVPRRPGDAALVRSVENDLATTYATLVGTTAADSRTALVDLLFDTALTLDAWGAEPTPFPGLPEQQD